MPPDVLELARTLMPEGFELRRVPARARSSEVAEAMREVNYVLGIVFHLPDEAYLNAHNLKLVQVLSAGYDMVNIEGARKARVPICSNGGANSVAVAEHAIMLMLAVYRQLPDLHGLLKAGKWKSNKFGEEEEHEVAGKTIGIIGLGMIGKTLARRLSGFEVKLLYTDPVRPSAEEEARLKVTYVEPDALFRESDIVTLHAPFDRSTHHMICDRTLQLMKRESILINCARGELVDEAALYRALKERRIWAAGLDTFDREPPDPKNPLFTLTNVVLTPHAAGPTWESWPKRFGNSYANVERVARGEAPRWVVPELRG